jgi:hypothetical protein
MERLRERRDKHLLNKYSLLRHFLSDNDYFKRKEKKVQQKKLDAAKVLEGVPDIAVSAEAHEGGIALTTADTTTGHPADAESSTVIGEETIANSSAGDNAAVCGSVEQEVMRPVALTAIDGPIPASAAVAVNSSASSSITMPSDTAMPIVLPHQEPAGETRITLGENAPTGSSYSMYADNQSAVSVAPSGDNTVSLDSNADASSFGKSAPEHKEAEPPLDTHESTVVSGAMNAPVVSFSGVSESVEKVGVDEEHLAADQEGTDTGADVPEDEDEEDDDPDPEKADEPLELQVSYAMRDVPLISQPPILKAELHEHQVSQHRIDC